VIPRQVVKSQETDHQQIIREIACHLASAFDQTTPDSGSFGQMVSCGTSVSLFADLATGHQHRQLPP
jgi:hypothetical protein